MDYITETLMQNRSDLIDTMHDYKKNLIKNISHIVHPKYAEEFLKTLHYAYSEENEIAKNLVDQLNIEKIDFMALLEDENEFENELIKLREEQWTA